MKWRLAALLLAALAPACLQQGMAAGMQADALAAGTPQAGGVQPATPQGLPQVSARPRDPDFGVATRHPGLQRQVEMYQWRRVGDAYERTWSRQRLDSSAFAPGHDNPPAMPLQERQWLAATRLDDKPLPPQLLRALGAWQAFHPDFSTLPGNMSATFQPEGDGLGSADNPLAPQIGDLRVRWRALVLPRLDQQLILRDGAWTLRAPHAAMPPVLPAAAGSPRRDPRGWLVAGVVVLGSSWWLAARRRKHGKARA